MLLTFVFCVSKRRGMTTKKPEEATLYLWLGIPLGYLKRFKFILKLIFLSLTDKH